jgi:hypothetical protein
VRITAAPVLLVVGLARMAAGQTPPTASLPASSPPPGTPSSADVLRVFVDCPDAWCDLEFIRIEVTFVNFVRERREADVHALITTRETGGGGREYTVSLLGAGRFGGIDHRILYFSPRTSTEDEIRKGLARTLRVGLARYAADTVLGPQLDVVHKRPLDGKSQGAAKGARDRWNAWVFRTSVRGSGSGEQSRRAAYLYGSLSANRVTEDWKVNLTSSGSYNRTTYTFPDEDTYTSISRNFSLAGLVVKSAGQHWAAGGRVSLSSSTFLNQHLATRVAPAVEYNFYPYKESTRRQLTLNYSAGVNTYSYREETIFGKMREARMDETAVLEWDLKQPWGTTSTAFEVSHYLNDIRKNRLVLFNAVDVRLFKGFSLSGYGSVSRIRNQLYLEKGEATAEEVLVRQRQLATSYQYYLSIGFSYSFGSIFNNVVNTRFQEPMTSYY